MRVMIAAYFFIFMTFGIYISSPESSAQQNDGNSYTGPNTCKMCHPKNHKSWVDSKMAKTFNRLNDENKKNKSCLSCHATGFEKGGYAIGKPPEENKKFEGVSCEACHGPGNNHFKAKGDEKKKKIILGKDVDCKPCHSIHNPPSMQ